MTVLLLARHGETNWAREKRWQGLGDHPLNARGRELARALFVGESVAEWNPALLLLEAPGI